MRTVRSRARARNQPRPHLAWVVVGALVLLVLAASRAGAQDSVGDGGRDDVALADADILSEGFADDADAAPTGTRAASHWFAMRSTRADPTAVWPRVPPGGARATSALAVRSGGDPVATAVVPVAYRGGPPLSAVVAAARRAAGVDTDPVPGWQRRSRWSALVPAISSRIGNSESWREVTDPTVSHSIAYDIRASWRLERLIYDPNEPRFAAFDLGRRRERRRIIALASRLYLGWLHAVSLDGDDPELAHRDALMQVELATAELDALTDGWFSQALANPARSQ